MASQFDVRPWTEDEWERSDRSFMASPFAQYLIKEGAEFIYRRIEADPARANLFQKPFHYGVDKPVYTILGKEFAGLINGIATGKPTVQARRGRKDMEDMYKELLTQVEPLPVMHKILSNNIEKIKTHKGTVDALAVAEKVKAYLPHNDPETDPAAIEDFIQDMVSAWNELAEPLRHSEKFPIEDVAAWGDQFPKNKNGGHPINTTVSSDWFYNHWWPMFKSDWIDMLNKPDVTFEDVHKQPLKNKKANEPVYYIGYRSPDRLIWMARFFSKIRGAFINKNVITGCGDGKTSQAWTNIAKLAQITTKARSRSLSTMYDDLKGYDTTFSLALLMAALKAYELSDFATDHLQLRNAVKLALMELCLPTTGQVSPTRALHVRPGLWSGVDITQLIGGVVHRGMYFKGNRSFDMELIETMVLSDDGKAESLKPAKELEAIMLGEYSEWLASIGMKLHPDKSFVVDHSVTTVLATRDGEPYEHADCGVFLQWFMGDGTLWGNDPRRRWSCYEKERDSRDDAIHNLVKLHASALRDSRSQSGATKPEYFDLYRLISIYATMGPDNPLEEVSDEWLFNTWPSFGRRFANMYDNVNPALWDEDIPSRGGTMESKMTTRHVVDRWRKKFAGDYEQEWTFPPVKGGSETDLQPPDSEATLINDSLHSSTSN